MSSLDGSRPIVQCAAARGNSHSARWKAVLPWAVGMGDHAGDGSTAPADATARSRAVIGAARGHPVGGYDTGGTTMNRVKRRDLAHGAGGV
jgi:hypothetical protein